MLQLWCANLYFEYNTSYGALDDVCSVEAVNAVDAEYTSLFTDGTAAVNPEQARSSAVTEKLCDSIQSGPKVFTPESNFKLLIIINKNN